MNRFRAGEAAQRSAERRRRQDEAPRLITLIPRLESLRLEVEEHRGGLSVAEARHIRRIVVEHAPALFELTCQDSSCEGGGHDLTAIVMRALRAGEGRFEGEDVCRGSVGTAAAHCGRVLRFVGVAAYRS
jgi:hypothetical protein